MANAQEYANLKPIGVAFGLIMFGLTLIVSVIYVLTEWDYETFLGALL